LFYFLFDKMHIHGIYTISCLFLHFFNMTKSTLLNKVSGLFSNSIFHLTSLNILNFH
jgi:hypothetical protein